MTTQASIGRIAIRVEGENWNAYWAETESLKGSIFLGSIKIAFIVHNPARKQAFIDLMTQCAADALQDIMGIRPEWNPPQDAPDSERSGNA